MIRSFIQLFIREKFTILLFLALVNVLAAPFLPIETDLELFMDITFTLVMVTAVATIPMDRKLPMAGSVLILLPSVLVIWWEFFAPAATTALASAGLQALFVAYMALLIILTIFKAPRVNRDVISAALVVYLFVALFFAKVFFMLELTYPGSFSVAHELLIDDPGILRYFSMVTMSTLGYGDILPVSRQAQTLAGVEALVGQIYLAVLIARLVSMHGVERSPSEKGKR